MTPRLPGARLYRWLEARMDRATFDSLIAPTIADLQHEVEAAGGRPWKRRRALVRGYGGVLRVLVGHGWSGGGVLRRWAVVSVMGIAGALLMAWSRSASAEARVVRSAFLLPLLLTPVVLRCSGAASAFRPLLRAAVAAGMLMCCLFPSAQFPATAGATRNLIQLLMLLVVVTILSSIAVATVAIPHSANEARQRRAILALVAGSGAAACVVIARQAGIGAYEPQRLAAMTPFFVVFLTIVQLPAFLLTAATASLTSRSWPGWTIPVLAGAVTFPLSAVIASIFDPGGIQELAGYLRYQPAMFFWHGLPFILGGLTFGWVLARPIRWTAATTPARA